MVPDLIPPPVSSAEAAPPVSKISSHAGQEDGHLPQASGQFTNAFRRAELFLLSQQPSPDEPNFLADGLPDAAYEYPKDLMKAVQAACQSHGLEVIFENPRGWMNGAGGSKYTRSLIMNIQMCLLQVGIPNIQQIVTSQNTFDRREVRPNQICFSYHSADTGLVDNPGIIRLKESYLPPYYTFDATGFSGWGTMANDQRLFHQSQAMKGPAAFAFVHKLREAAAKGLSKYVQPESVGAPIEGNYVFHPMQISDDSVMGLARIKSYELLRQLIDTAKQTGVNLVIKRHPRCKDQNTADLLTEVAAERSPLIHISTASINDLISHSQAVVVVNSGTGMEALIRGKPVYCAGHSDYHYLAHAVKNANDLAPAFESPAARTDPWTEATFIHYYFTRYCVNACDARGIQKRVFAALANWAELQVN